MITKIEMQAMEAVIGIRQELRHANDKHIDWEQRRYEIAKEALPAFINFIGASNGDSVKYAIECADMMIEKLKGGAK